MRPTPGFRDEGSRRVAGRLCCPLVLLADWQFVQGRIQKEPDGLISHPAQDQEEDRDCQERPEVIRDAPNTFPD